MSLPAGIKITHNFSLTLSKIDASICSGFFSNADLTCRACAQKDFCYILLDKITRILLLSKIPSPPPTLPTAFWDFGAPLNHRYGLSTPVWLWSHSPGIPRYTSTPSPDNWSFHSDYISVWVIVEIFWWEDLKTRLAAQWEMGELKFTDDLQNQDELWSSFYCDITADQQSQQEEIENFTESHLEFNKLIRLACRSEYQMNMQ